MHHSIPTPEEITKLDALLKVLVDQESFIQTYDLVECAGYAKAGPRIEKEFIHYLTIFRDCNAARVVIEPDNNMGHYNDNSLKFQKDGGFRGYFERWQDQQQKKANREALEFEKTQIDFELAKKMLKDYPTTKKIAIVGVIIASVVALFEIGKLLFA